LIVDSNETLQIALDAGHAQTDVLFRIYFRPDPQPGTISQPLQFASDPDLYLPILGWAGIPITLETSYDLSTWFEYRTFNPTNDGTFLSDPIYPDYDAKFFRIHFDVPSP